MQPGSPLIMALYIVLIREYEGILPACFDDHPL